jgi:glutathione S-transferase
LVFRARRAVSAVLLHRFPISNFSEKGRALLECKGVAYDVREHRAGLPQLRLIALSGQRKVPVIEHAGRVVHDSTAIAHYLDRAFPARPPLIPIDEPRRSEVLALEDEIDAVLGAGAPLLWLDDVLRGRRTDELDLLSTEVHGLSPAVARALGRGLGAARALGLGERMFRRRIDDARALLSRLASRLESAPYLVGDTPTLADLAAVGLTLHLEWPTSPRLPAGVPRGRGVASVVEAPELRRFFAWRRTLYERFLG